MTGNSDLSKNDGVEVVFLGSSGAIQVPAFFCSCDVCESARRDSTRGRTRASLALLGEEVTLIDASPDIEFQLERERISKIDGIFITHWHYDHVLGLGAFAEPAQCGNWPPINIYLPHQVVYHFDAELAYMKNKVNLHPIQPGDILELKDATWEVVKTTHNEHSVGFIVCCTRTFAYLVDGILPPPETVERLGRCDILITEATMDYLDEDNWYNFSVAQAVDFWKQTGISECILTHLSCHGWQNKRLIAGFSEDERTSYAAARVGLKFAYDSMCLSV